MKYAYTMMLGMFMFAKTDRTLVLEMKVNCILSNDKSGGKVYDVLKV